MSWLKKDPFLGALFFAVMLIVGAEGWLLWRTRLEAGRALAGLEQKKREREDLQHRSPPPTDEVARMITADLDSATAGLSEAIAAISTPTDWAVPSGAANPVDAYFEIARFVETQRTTAKRQNIAIKSDEHFGFTSYARQGPDAPILPTVLEQRAAVGKLTDALFAAGPAALIAIQRERPVAILQRERVDRTSPEKNVRAKSEERREEAADFFDPIPSVSLRVSGKIKTSAFRVEFSGATQVLRDFLNALSVSETPFFVRSVEVEPLTDAPKPSIGAGTISGPVPVVMNSVSRFQVTIELLKSAQEAEGATR
jgi:hypothetical protein